MKTEELKDVCRLVRRDIVASLCAAKSGHPGGSLSAVEIVTALYFAKMNIDPKDPKKADRDRFVLSKGHAAPVLYSVLAERGYFDPSELLTLRKMGSFLQGHPDAKKCPGVDASTGSLGQGVSIATGMALGAKLARSNIQVYTLVGDGECQEGLVWEAAEAAAHYKLDNLTAIIDRNHLSYDGDTEAVMGLDSLSAKLDSFGWHVSRCDGHSTQALLEAFGEVESGRPHAVIAETVKGKGVSFAENRPEWHHHRLSQEEYEQARREILGEEP